MAWTIENEAAGANSARYVLKDDEGTERKRWPVRTLFQTVVREALAEHQEPGAKSCLYLDENGTWSVCDTYDW
jgi:hypothetical protein